METTINSVTQIGKYTSDLGTMIVGRVGHAMIQAELKAVHDKTETAISQVIQKPTANESHTDSTTQQLIDRMNDMETT